MTHPWATLGLPPDADEATIRRRYLQLVREHPPDRCPERFREIHSAYDALRDPVRRLSQQLFELESTRSMEDVLDQLKARGKRKRVPTSLLLSLGAP